MAFDLISLPIADAIPRAFLLNITIVVRYASDDF